MVQAGVGGESVMAGAVSHKNYRFIGGKRRHLLAQRLHQLDVIVMAAQQRRPQRQAEEQRAQALHFADDLFILIAVDNVQRLGI